MDDRPRVTLDWTAVEGSLKLALPDDYKELVELFPPGRFQGFVKLIRPGDHGRSETEYLGYYERRLADMRRWRKDESRRFPYPIHPEPNGLLPWGVTHRGDLFFWLTTTDDPNLWPLVTTDFEFSRWVEHDPSICKFLHGVMTGRFDASAFEIDLSGGPRYKIARSSTAPSKPQGRGTFWQRFASAPGVPRKDFESVAESLNSPVRGAAQVDWSLVESQLKVTFPSDYKRFIDVYGPGMLGGIVIASPAGTGEASLLGMIEWHYRRSATAPWRRDRDAPIFPESSGMIVWGKAGNVACCWAPINSDPESWCVVMVDDHGNLQLSPDSSFSGFLATYLDQGALDPITFSDVARPETITFTPM